MTSIFEKDQDRYVPTAAAGGPWSSDMLQGSATTALLAREVETIADAKQLALRRLTFDLLRPARLQAIRIKTEAIREGKKASRYLLTLLDRHVAIAQCTALLVAATETPPVAAANGTYMPPKAGAPPPSYAQKWSRYFEHVTVRLIEGALEKPGPAAAWLKLDIPLVANEPNSALTQAVQAADFASGISQTVDMRQWSFINPEITIHFSRMPREQWILVRAATTVGSQGAGIAKATLFDLGGAFAEVSQSIMFEKRGLAV